VLCPGIGWSVLYSMWSTWWQICCVWVLQPTSAFRLPWASYLSVCVAFVLLVMFHWLCHDKLALSVTFVHQSWHVCGMIGWLSARIKLMRPIFHKFQIGNFFYSSVSYNIISSYYSLKWRKILHWHQESLMHAAICCHYSTALQCEHKCTDLLTYTLVYGGGIAANVCLMLLFSLA